MRPSCPNPRRLEQLLLGRLHGVEADALEEHLQSCPRCADELEKRACVDPLVEAMRAASEEDQNSSELIQRLIGQFKQLPAPQETVSHVGQGTVPPAGSLRPLLAPAREAGELGWLGPYRVLEVLGQGGMGIVYRGEDLRLKRPVALKVIKPDLLPNEVLRQRFRHEAEAIAAVEHDNIVVVHEVNEEGGVPYLVMPLLRGQSLEARLGHVAGPLPLDEILSIGRLEFPTKSGHEVKRFRGYTSPRSRPNRKPRTARGVGSPGRAKSGGAFFRPQLPQLPVKGSRAGQPLLVALLVWPARVGPVPAVW